jgi:hypothetical protein
LLLIAGAPQKELARQDRKGEEPVAPRSRRHDNADLARSTTLINLHALGVVLRVENTL